MQKDILNRLSRIDYLIRIKGTGTPAQLAEKLDISERTVYEYLNLMKEFGAPIKFDNFRQSYYYENDGHFWIAFLAKRQPNGNGNISVDRNDTSKTG